MIKDKLIRVVASYKELGIVNKKRRNNYEILVDISERFAEANVDAVVLQMLGTNVTIEYKLEHETRAEDVFQKIMEDYQ